MIADGDEIHVDTTQVQQVCECKKIGSRASGYPWLDYVVQLDYESLTGFPVIGLGTTRPTAR